MTIIGLGYRGKHLIASNISWYVAIPGLLILLPFIVWFFISNRKLQRQHFESFKRLKDLKLIGIEKKIDLRDVKIEEERLTINLGSVQTINRYGIENHSIKLIISLEGEIIEYSFLTDINKDNLKVHFAMHQFTNIYVDRSNKNNYYLDLEFLTMEKN